MASTTTAFENARLVLVEIAGQRSDALPAWTAMAGQAGGLVDAGGNSHLATLILHDVRIEPWQCNSTGGVPAAATLARLAEASRAAGWTMADGEAVVAAALQRGSPDVLEWAVGSVVLPGRDGDHR